MTEPTKDIPLKIRPEHEIRLKTLIEDSLRTGAVTKEIWELNGPTIQLHKAAEECCELAVELHHHAEGRDNKFSLMSELADVEIMLSQVKSNLDLDLDAFAIIKRQKVFRLQKRIEKRKQES